MGTWEEKQAAAKPARYYGEGGTIYGNHELDVEVFRGQVVAVWFRCARLPFKKHEVGSERADEMALEYGEELARLTGVELLDPGIEIPECPDPTLVSNVAAHLKKIYRQMKEE